jgi:hypothetical protein
MIPVVVIAAQGAVVRGPCKLKLSREQWQRRVHALGPVPKKLRPVGLDGSFALTFKCGEEFGIDEFKGRLNKALFERLDEPDEAPLAEGDSEGSEGSAAGADDDGGAESGDDGLPL